MGLKAPRPAGEMPANCAVSRLAIAVAVSPERLAPSAPTCVGVRASTCAALSPETAAADRPEMSVPSATICGFESAVTWPAVTPVSCAGVRASNCAALSDCKAAPAICEASRLAMAPRVSALTRLPSALSCADDRPSTCVAVSSDTRTRPVPMSLSN